MQRLLFGLIRATGGALPSWMLLALLWPPAVLRAAIDVALRGRRPPAALPPQRGRAASMGQALYNRTHYRLAPLAGFWADRSGESPWSSRFDLSALDQIRPLVAERPIVLASLHYGALVMVPPLLCQAGVPAALAVNSEAWPLSRIRQLRLELVRVGDLPTVVRADARAMLRFLRPGRCLVVAVDLPTAEYAEISFENSLFRVSTPPLRLARLAGARVVPMLGINRGTWKVELYLGRPVPDELIREGNYAAAAAHIGSELLPIAARAPGQALPSLVEAFVPLADQVSEIGTPAFGAA